MPGAADSFEPAAVFLVFAPMRGVFDDPVEGGVVAQIEARFFRFDPFMFFYFQNLLVEFFLEAILPPFDSVMFQPVGDGKIYPDIVSGFFG